MTARCNLNESDYRAFQRHVLFKHWKMHWVFCGLLALILLAAWFGRRPEEPMTDTILLMIGSVVIFGCWALVASLVTLLIRRFIGTRYRGTVGEHLFEISDEGLTESNDNGKVETRLCGIRRIDETPKHFFVITTTGVGHVIPKRDLESLDAIRALQHRIMKSSG